MAGDPAKPPAPAQVAGAPGGLLDELRVAAAVLDRDGRIVLWSPQAEELFGYSVDEALGQRADRLLLTPENRQVAAELFREVRKGMTWAGVFPVRHKDGTTRHVEFRNMRLHDMDSNIYALGLAADVATIRDVETDLALSDRLVTQSPLGLAVLDTDLRYVRVNAALARMNGLPAKEHLGRHLAEVLPDVDVEAIDAAMRQVLRTGEPVLDRRTVGRTRADPGRDRTWSVSLFRLDDARGRVLGLAGCVIDMTDRHEAAAEADAARARLEAIAEASDRIGSTLDLRQTAQELAEIVVPRIADMATVDVLDEVLRGERHPRIGAEGSATFRALAVVAGYPTEAVRAPDAVGEVSTHAPTRLVSQAVREGRPVLLPEVGPETVMHIARNAEAAELLTRAGLHSYLALPLVARGVVIGIIGLFRTVNPRPFDEQDLTLAAELASRAAVCMDNARLYGLERATAVALQRSLLPGEPPYHDSLEMACRYRPARQTEEVGGDWYDVLPRKDGTVALVVGDVMGSGVHAAAIMGQLRTATRTLAGLGLAPADLLHHLGDAAALGDSIATCLYALCDTANGRCELSSAGHLPPILVSPDGRGELVDIPVAPPLGVGGVPFGTVHRDLPPGALLALYTDGLVESRETPIDEGIRALRRVLEGPPRPLQEMCDLILSTLPPGTDDIAFLLARRRVTAEVSVARGGGA